MKWIGLLVAIMALTGGLEIGRQAAAQTGIVRGQTTPTIDAIDNRVHQATMPDPAAGTRPAAQTGGQTRANGERHRPFHRRNRVRKN